MSAAPDSIKKLVDNFGEHLDHYKSQGYNETELRREYLDPFWKALGWDIDNRAGYADQYKDVVHEYSFRTKDKLEAPDYSFRIGGTRKFFLEAKKPSVDIQFDTAPAFQLRRYAWSAKLPLSVLSDFEEFSIYDCRFRPDAKDKASTARTLYMRFDKYLDRWEEIEGIFSREAILHGSFDKYVVDNKKKRGTAEVDDVFLTEIERWRELLAKNIVLRNPHLTVRDLNYAVQVIIDRIIFLRICEDRGTEDYQNLAKAVAKKEAYPALLDRFRAADARYNSGLFHFTDEKSQNTAPDRLTPTLTVDAKALRDIVDGLYYPQSPYAFTVLPPDILGHVYEQFLGKTIVLGGGEKRKTVTIEEKPEVRKAGGVYYTPTYIVDYIVENTLGRLLNGDDPAEPRPISVSQAAALKVLDPACGSGSFLIVAYQYLLDWHRDQYTLDYAAGPDPATGLPPLDPNKIKRHGGGKSPKIFQDDTGEYRLTIDERKRILLNNVHGVDLDSQAVEVTKLSLLLKVIEGETAQVTQRDMFKERERILPDLGQNIQCGNSLIGPDFYAQPDLPELDDDTKYRINVFDWKKSFPEVFKAGGFDCVIGNPPYLSIDDVWGNNDPKLKYLKWHYDDIHNDKTDILFYFYGLSLNVGKGLIGFIVSRAFLEAYKADKLRQTILNQSGVKEIVDFRNYQVFERVGIATAITILDKGSKEIETIAHHLFDDNWQPTAELGQPNAFVRYSRGLQKLGSVPWIFGTVSTVELYEKLDRGKRELGDVIEIGQGMQTGANGVFGKKSLEWMKEKKISDSLVKKRATNSDILRYSITDRGEKILYLEDEQHFDRLPAPLQNYLLSEEEKLTNRAAFKRGDCEWWKFTWPLSRNLYDGRARILCPYLGTFNRFALVEGEEFLSLTDTTVIFDSNQDEDIKYLLGLLNSKTLTFRFRGIGKLKGGGIYEYFWNSIKRLPIRPIDFKNPDDVAKHDKMVALVDTMLDLHRRKAGEKNPQSLRQLETQITATDSQIDALVYALYDLTPDEIALVEA